MGKGGRYGKYGEHKRFERLRQAKGQAIKISRILQERGSSADLMRRKGERESEDHKVGRIEKDDRIV